MSSQDADPGSPSPARPLDRRRFLTLTTAYVLLVLGMVGLSNIAAAEWFFVVEIATMPTGVFWFLGGASIVIAIGSLLGGAGAIVLYGAFAMSAFTNAVLVREVARAARQLRGAAAKSGRAAPTSSDATGRTGSALNGRLGAVWSALIDRRDRRFAPTSQPNRSEGGHPEAYAGAVSRTSVLVGAGAGC